MRIIIIGAGEVGTHIASLLSEDHDVVVIDKNPARCQRLNEQHNILAIQGNGAHPEVLEKAGLSKTSLLIAVTESDTVNLTASLISKLSGVENQRRVVRLEASQFDPRGNPKAKDVIEAVGADLVVDPDRGVAEYIEEMLAFGYPGVAEHASMANGEILVLGAQVRANSELAGTDLSTIGKKYDPAWPYMVSSITRGEETIIPRKDECIKEGDVVRVVCLASRAEEFMQDLGLTDLRYRRVLLLGGGRTGELLAQSLVKRGIRVRLVEEDEDRIEELTEALPKDVEIYRGDVTETDFLESISIDRYDAVLALMGDDEANILSCLYAKSQGVRVAITRLHRATLKTITEKLDIDVAISPRTSCANEVLRFVLSPDSDFDSDSDSDGSGSGTTSAHLSGHSRGILQIATFLSMDLEVLEFTVEPGSKVAGQIIREVGFHKEELIGAVIREVDGKAVSLIARGDTRLRVDDHLIMVTSHDRYDEVSHYFCSQ